MQTSVGGRIVDIQLLQILKEGPDFILLPDAQEIALDSFRLGAGDLVDLAAAINKACRDLLELKVPSNVGVDEDVGEFTGGDDELGDEVDSVVAVATKLSWRFLSRSELAIKLLDIGRMSKSSGAR